MSDASANDERGALTFQNCGGLDYNGRPPGCGLMIKHGNHSAGFIFESALRGLAAITFPAFSKTLAVSPTLSFSNAALVLIESVVSLISLSFVLIVRLPVFGSTDITLPVRTVA